MAAPQIALSMFGVTKLGRGLILGVLAAVACTALLVALPVVPILLSVTGTGSASASTKGQLPAVRGEWGYPLAGDYTKGRGFSFDPALGCAYCNGNHEGYDMAQGCGRTIYAAGPGIVRTTGPSGNWGNAVRIDHGDGIVTLYAHMQWDSIRVAVGDTVAAGTPIGSEGNTGRSYGCHLHIEVQVDQHAIDPQPFMAARGLPLK